MSVGRSVLVLAVLTLSLPAAAVHAARVPKWARPVVEEAPPVPEGIGRYPERILLDETREEVREDGTVLVSSRFATQALTSRSSQIGIGSFYFDETREMRITKAWHIPPGEGAKRDRRPPVDVTLGGDFLNDSKVRAVEVRDVRKGSIILFEFSAVETPYMLPRAHHFDNDAPARVQRYILQVPEGWKVEWDWVRLDGPEPVVDGTTWTWELLDRDPPSDETLGPSRLAQWPAVYVNLIPPEGQEVEPAVVADWAAFSAWYDRLTRDRHKADESIVTAAGEALGGWDGDFYEAVGSAGRFVRDKVRYVAVELGIGGMQPRPAVETLSNLYGDCKDKGTLLRSVLSTEDMKSYPVLVNLSEHDTVSETIPAWGFNHFVVAIPVPEGAEVPEAFAHAIIDAGEGFGRLLIVDTTDEKTSVGSISDSLSGKRALLVAGDRGRLVTLPGTDPDAHRVSRRLNGELSAGSALSLERTSSYFGAFASWARASYSRSATDRRKAVERRIIGIWPEARIEDFESEYETEDGAYEETIKARILVKAVSGGGKRLALFPGARSELQRVSLGKREVPVIYDHPRTIRYDVILTGIPDGVEAPAASEHSGDGWSLSTSVALQGGTLTASWELILKKTRFEPGEFGGLRELWKAISRTASAGVDLPG